MLYKKNIGDRIITENGVKFVVTQKFKIPSKYFRKKLACCLKCNGLIVTTIAKNTKFCSRSCAAKYYGERGGGWANVNEKYKNNKEWRKMLRENGSKASKIVRYKRNIKFNNIYFDSFRELDTAMCIHFQFSKIKEDKNYQIKIGPFTYDFLVDQCFIEYHPRLYFLNSRKYEDNYYQNRRRNLDNNGYEKYNLIIIRE